VQLQLVSRSSTHAALSHRCNAPAPCVDYDADNDLWLVRGRSFKNAVDADGNKLPAGELRRDLWVVVGIVAQAIGLLERAAPATVSHLDLALPAEADRGETARVCRLFA
jgi:hypothetical protein